MSFSSPFAIGLPYATLNNLVDMGLDVKNLFDNIDFNLIKN